MEPLCEIGDESSYVGTAGAGDFESSRLLCRVCSYEVEGVDGYGAGFALDGDAAAVQVVETDALALEGGGHRGDLEEFAGEAGECGADGGFVGHRGIQRSYIAVCVKRVGDGTEAGCSGIGLVQVGDVTREAGGASDQDHQQPAGKRVESAGVSDLGLWRKKALHLRDRPGARDAGRLVEE